MQYEVVDGAGEVLVRTNRNIIDDDRSQTMTAEEIEVLKMEGKDSGRDLIAKILDSHSALDQKTAFGLAKYTLRKTKKFLRRFTALPLDVSLLSNWMLHERDAVKIMEIREEMIALIASWSNIHFTPASLHTSSQDSQIGSGRWLIVDETGGLLVSLVAERLGVLHPCTSSQIEAASAKAPEQTAALTEADQRQLQSSHRNSSFARDNIITLLHANSQPNLSLLRYFSFDPANPSPSHPLTAHLKTLSWLQLLDPSSDNTCTEPDIVPPETLSSWKSGKRGNYHRKRRRWERTTSVVADTQAGGFDGLIVASHMAPAGILQHLVPLLRGAAQVVVYSPYIEPLVELADYYSTQRKTAFLNDPPTPEEIPTEDFPVNPMLLLAPTVQTIRCKGWQVLPGRTHPLMMGRGGAEGYLFTGTRVLPAEGKVEARGRSKRRRKGVAIQNEGSENAEHVREQKSDAGIQPSRASGEEESRSPTPDAHALLQEIRHFLDKEPL